VPNGARRLSPAEKGLKSEVRQRNL
jgi:hypothetical protein